MLIKILNLFNILLIDCLTICYSYNNLIIKQ